MRVACLLLALVLASCAGSRPDAGDGLPADLPFLSRAEWGAADPVGPMRRQVPDKITVHHTATTANPDRSNADKLRGLQAFSQRADTLGDGRPKVAWPDVPYHYYVAHDGTVVEARDVRFEGDTNTDYPLAGHVQVVVEGNFEETEPTAAQMESLTRLVVALARRWEISADALAGHGDRAVGQTACPGASLLRRLPDLRQAVADTR